MSDGKNHQLSPTLDDLERQKLRLEVELLRSPFKRNPALWITTATTIIAAAAFIGQLHLSKQDFLLAERRSALAEIQRQRTLLDLDRKANDLEELNRTFHETQSALEQSKMEVVTLTREREELDRERLLLETENQTLKARHYYSSLAGEKVLMPKAIVVRGLTEDGQIDGPIGPDYQDIVLTLVKKDSDADDTGYGTVQFCYSNGVDQVKLTRSDMSDFFTWDLDAKIKTTRGEKPITFSAHKTSDDGYSTLDHPLFGYSDLADSAGQRYALLPTTSLW